MGTVKIAMIGVGAISGIYLENITNVFKEIEIIGVCDLVRERAENAKEKYQIKKIYDTMYDAFKDPEVDMVLNLTRPYEHFEVTKEALNAGKHVYSEKPLGANFDEGKALVALAEEKNLMLGGAPDTFLGSGIQTCRKLIDDGFIGEPIGAAAFMICRGHETWHPDPEFYYKYGGGPMLDMGPYYVTALVNLLGGVNSVTGVTKSSFSKRTITSQPKVGTVIDVDVPTYITGILNFDNGAVGTIFTTFDVYYNQQARLEIYGSKGTLLIPDPNTFGGSIKLLRPEDGEYKEMPLLFDYKENSRGLGVADMAKALQTGRDYRANYKQTCHVLEVLTSFEKSSKEGKSITLKTAYNREIPMLNNPIHGILD
ncbi:Gfo/Idh/MocA family protein [Anaerocolumna sp. MB42-C2]|uniref:Gfo/Idh/MocA family protein n=1 Tax=Anaerocolumna sp. MB42-C2 TaxID=3070997 RepID=UPI0027E18269|nr:Gfo/Idh/MocA family oxidoreductase [Anaerocolumna sp. MB42-C2]WMJ86637.1 Gfo/Idh/MocA family oxidoreductase [Anaerocolumna sp. MB42-C2]